MPLLPVEVFTLGNTKCMGLKTIYLFQIVKKVPFAFIFYTVKLVLGNIYKSLINIDLYKTMA
jgi:hypothetical protein